MEDVSKSGESLASKLKNGLATAGRVAATGIGAITAAAGAAVGGLLALEQSTEEYRAAMGRLNTAFEAAGYGADTAQEAYRGFFGILGDTDTATEASQLLAQLADSAEDVSVWTNIAAGVNGTFGDSLPIEGLIEAANETANVGTVTGVLADALNWVGISEDEFNEKLAKCSSESERNQLIMETLAGQYDKAADAFYRNNEALVESRNAQVQMDAVLAQLGQTVSNIRSQLTAEFLPSIANVATAFNNMLNGVEGADQQFATAVQGLVNQGVSLLPQFLRFGTQILTSLLSGIVQSIPALVSAAPQIITEIGSALMGLFPQVVAMGSQLIDQLTSGLESAVPNMIERAPVIIDEFLNFITENLPDVLDKGVEMINYLVNGILDTVPQMVAQLPAIITAFIEFIADNIPTILDAGANILINLVTGLIEAIPELIASLPEIISALTDGLADAAPKIISAGFNIIKKLIEGIISSVPKLVASLPEIVNSIITGIGNLMSGIVEIGANIVRGIWDGIVGMGQWLIDQVTGFFGGIVDGVKNFLGIKSPSRVFAGIGENMALGLGEGWDNEYGRIRRDIESGMDFGTANVDFASSGLGVSSAGIINSMAPRQTGTSSPMTINLVTADGQRLASWLLNDLVNVSRANGTPILA